MISENILRTRISLKYDTIERWAVSTLVLRAGEVAFGYHADGSIEMRVGAYPNGSVWNASPVTVSGALPDFMGSYVILDAETYGLSPINVTKDIANITPFVTSVKEAYNAGKRIIIKDGDWQYEMSGAFIPETGDMFGITISGGNLIPTSDGYESEIQSVVIFTEDGVDGKLYFSTVSGSEGVSVNVAENDKLLSLSDSGELSSTLSMVYDSEVGKMFLYGVNGAVISEISTADFTADSAFKSVSVVKGTWNDDNFVEGNNGSEDALKFIWTDGDGVEKSVFINMARYFTPYTAGDGIEISDNVINVTNRVVAGVDNGVVKSVIGNSVGGVLSSVEKGGKTASVAVVAPEEDNVDPFVKMVVSNSSNNGGVVCLQLDGDGLYYTKDGGEVTPGDEVATLKDVVLSIGGYSGALAVGDGIGVSVKVDEESGNEVNVLTVNTDESLEVGEDGKVGVSGNIVWSCGGSEVSEE